MSLQTKLRLANICGIVAMVLYFVYDDVSWLIWAVFMYYMGAHNETLIALQNVTKAINNSTAAERGSAPGQYDLPNGPETGRADS